MQELKSKHQNEKDQLENEFQKELNSCTDFWGDKIVQYDEQSQALEKELRAKHEEKQEAYQTKLVEEMPKAGKMTPEILNIQYQIERQVKTQNYKEAHALQKRMENLRSKCENKIDDATSGQGKKIPISRKYHHCIFFKYHIVFLVFFLL